MFTGLIEEVGDVKAVHRGIVNRLEVRCRRTWESVGLGDSVAINGACLTVESVADGVLEFSFVRETAARTALGELRTGDKVNMETSLRAGEAIGGHFVLGHVDGTGVISSIQNIGESQEIVFSADRGIMRLIVEKGSVAIDGISLTVAECTSHSFKVALIPHSLENTNLKYKKIGDKVNLETDILGKYVYRFLSENNSGGDIMDALRKSGFI